MAALTFNSTIRLTSGFNIPRLGFGVAYGFGKYEDPSELTVPSVLEALKVGYRHFDTAQMYGNEEDVGEAIRQSGVNREEVFVTSKVPSGGYKNVLSAVDTSLRRLGFDYLDMYLIHSPPSGTKHRLETWRAFIDAKKQGKVRTIGVSNYNVAHLEEIKQAGYELPSVNQIELHPFCQQKPIVDWCRANNVQVEAYCPVLRGRLSDPVVGDIAKKVNKEPAQVLLRWSLQSGFIPLIRSSNRTRIRSNTELYDFTLSEEDMKRLNALDRGSRGAVSWNPIHRS